MSSKAPLPERPRSHQVGEEACREIEKFFWPHLVERRVADYGKDFRVQLVDHSQATHLVTGREFSIQAKGSEHGPHNSAVVDVPTFNSWRNSIEPVLLVKVLAPGTAESQMHGAWIDAELITALHRASPTWRDQKTVTIPLGLTLTKDLLPEIERVVNRWPEGRCPIEWQPEDFASVESEAAALASELAKISGTAGLEGPVASLRDAAKQLERISYAVAVLGNSRVGKSTLLNRLLGREISPVDQFPTTAVAMSISYAESATGTVHLLDGKKISGEPTAAFLSPFVTQQGNRDNAKHVSHVEVELPDPILRGGITLVDLPGFHDADSEIRAISDAALERVDACLYLIDVAPASSNSFAFTEQHRERISDLLKDCESVILVLSKADELNKTQRSKVQDYVLAELKRYDLLDRLALPPILIGMPPSSSRSRAPKAATGISAEELRAKVWSVLLRDGAIASARAQEALVGIIAAHRDTTRAIRARLLVGQQASDLQAKLNIVEAEIAQICGDVRTKAKNISASSASRVHASIASLAASYAEWLRSIPAGKPLPSNKDIRAYLLGEAQRILTAEAQTVSRDIAAVKLDAEERVQRILEQLPIGEIQALPLGLPQVPEIAPFPVTAVQRGVLGSIGVGFAAWLFGGPVTIGLAIAGFLIGAVLDADKSHARDIENRIKTVNDLVPGLTTQITSPIYNGLVRFAEQLCQRTAERGKYAVHDLRKDLAKSGTLTAAETARLTALLQALQPVAKRLEALYTRILRATGMPVPVEEKTS